VLCLIARWVENPNSEAYKLHLARIPDYFWLAEDGLKIQVSISLLRNLFHFSFSFSATNVYGKTCQSE